MPPTPKPTRAPSQTANRLFTAYLVFGLGFMAVGVLVGRLGLPPAGVGFTLFGTFFALIGVAGRRSRAGVSLVNRSLDLLGRGRLTEAEALLTEAEKHIKKGANLRAIRTQRALIASRRGDVEGAILHASAAIVAGRAPGLVDRLHVINARGLRAFFRASKDDRPGAREDIAAVRASADATPQALGRAAVAEAILLEREGDRQALREHLLRERRVLLDGTDPRERAIVRAYQRMLAAPTTSVYRSVAKREPELQGEEPAVADWIAKVAPGAAPFARVPGSSAASGAPLPTPSATDAGRLALKASRAAGAATGKRQFRRGMVRRLALLAGAVAAILIPWALLHDGGAPGLDPEPIDQVFTALGPIAASVAFGGMAVLVYIGVRARRQMGDLLKAVTGLVKGDPAASATLERLAERAPEILGAQAHLALARAAERAADLPGALLHADRGLGRLSRWATRVVAADLIYPELAAERAFLLAAQGRDAEAVAEIEALNPAYPFLSRARFRVRLVTLARAGDLAGAARLVDEAGVDLPLDARDEMLADASRVAARPEAAGAGEVLRVKDELRTQPELRRWMEAVAPAVLRAAELASEGSDEDAAQELAAVEEARAAEEEASASGMAARRLDDPLARA